MKDFSNSKLSSGRFLLTIVSAICFLILTGTFCNILINKSDDMKVSELLPYVSTMLLVVSNIFTFYFTKNNIIEK